VFGNCVILGTSLLTVVISPGYLIRRKLHHGEYYSLLMAATVGMMLLAGATSLMVIFLAIELLSISLYILSGFSRQEERSQEAAVKYCCSAPSPPRSSSSGWRWCTARPGTPSSPRSPPR